MVEITKIFAVEFTTTQNPTILETVFVRANTVKSARKEFKLRYMNNNEKFDAIIKNVEFEYDEESECEY